MIPPDGLQMTKLVSLPRPLTPANAGRRLEWLAAGRLALNDRIHRPRPEALSSTIWVPAFAGMSGFKFVRWPNRHQDRATALNHISGKAA